jgi:hypothetical protein
MRRVCCTYHCDCGAHFASLAAFELHRAGSFQKRTRHCIDPEGVKRLVVKTEEGYCDLKRGEPSGNATVFQTVEGARAGVRPALSARKKSVGV